MNNLNILLKWILIECCGVTIPPDVRKAALRLYSKDGQQLKDSLETYKVGDYTISLLQHKQIQEEIYNRKPISAIKLLRDIVGCTLTDAKIALGL